MKTVLISIAVASLLGIPDAYAAVTPEQVKTCETFLREKNRTDKSAAPEGYKVSRPRNFRQSFLAECLTNGR